MADSPDWIQAWIKAQSEALERLAIPRGDPGGFVDFLGNLQGQFLGLPGFGFAAGMTDWWHRFVPANSGIPEGGWGSMAGSLGPQREQQQLVESLARALAHYQKVSADLTGVLTAVHRETLDLLVRRVTERANSGQPVSDFKALYDLWIECGETIYAKVVSDEPYCRLQAEVGNAATAVQSLQQQLLERWLKQLDLPTRSELNTLHRRVLDLQRRLDAVGASQSRRTSSRQSPTATKRRAPRKPAKRP